MKRKAAFEAADSEANLPSIKRRKTTMWHEYLKEFAKSQGLNDSGMITNTDTSYFSVSFSWESCHG